MNDVAAMAPPLGYGADLPHLAGSQQTNRRRPQPMQLRKRPRNGCAPGYYCALQLAEPIEGNNKKRVAEVATISAADAAIGDPIADVMDKAGRDGVVTVEEGQGLALEKEVVAGFTFDRGFVSPLWPDTARMEAVYDKPAVVITDRKLSSIQNSCRC